MDPHSAGLTYNALPQKLFTLLEKMPNKEPVKNSMEAHVPHKTASKRFEMRRVLFLFSMHAPLP